MTGFTSIAQYAPSLVFLAGAFTIAGILGIGNRIGRALRLPQPWLSVVGSLAAMEIFTLIDEAVSMAQIAMRGVLLALWVVFSLIGAALLRPRFRLDRYTAAPIAILIFNLLIALCPSTKGDEVYYHMIVPSRIVQDGGLLFYREPLRAAIYPQMAFQMGFAPFHALALPDVGNVVSWFFGALLVWFTFAIVEKRTGSRVWAAVFAGAISCGLYTTVWHTTSGAHAIGDLAVTASVVALYVIDDLRSPIAIGILIAAFASTKVFFFPLALAIGLIAIVRLRSFMVAVAPLLFIAPLMIWTALHAGSPFGPLAEGITGPSPYFPGEVHAFVDDYVAGPRGPIPDKLRDEAVNFSPILLLSIVAFVTMRRHLAVDPKIGIALLVLQAVVILGWNTYDARYFGGVHYALMILFAMFVSEAIRNRILAARWFPAAVALLIVPWMMLQLVYGAQFMKLIFHLESKHAFLERYVPLYRDFVWLDRALPRDAVLLSIPYGLASIYAPRPLYYHVLDVPPRRPVFLVSYDPTGPLKIGEEIYTNRAAVIATFRIPGRKPQIGTLHVWRLN
jgi:hypothetical protein